jgi:hypothetical protein
MAPKSIPSVVQLPGGIKLNAVPFKVIERDDEGRPLKFEILPPGERGEWMLFAHEPSIRSKGPEKP